MKSRLLITLVALLATSLFSQAPALRVVASGKEAVLAFFEKDASQRTGGKDGVYRVYADHNGNAAVVIIAGHIYSGDGKVTAANLPDMKNWTVENGVVTKLIDR